MLLPADRPACPCFAQVTPLLAQYPCDSITLSYRRDTMVMEARIFIGDQALLGVRCVAPWEYYTPVHTDYTLLEAIPAGICYD